MYSSHPPFSNRKASPFQSASGLVYIVCGLAILYAFFFAQWRDTTSSNETLNAIITQIRDELSWIQGVDTEMYRWINLESYALYGLPSLGGILVLAGLWSLGSGFFPRQRMPKGAGMGIFTIIIGMIFLVGLPLLILVGYFLFYEGYYWQIRDGSRMFNLNNFIDFVQTRLKGDGIELMVLAIGAVAVSSFGITSRNMMRRNPYAYTYPPQYQQAYYPAQQPYYPPQHQQMPQQPYYPPPYQQPPQQPYYPPQQPYQPPQPQRGRRGRVNNLAQGLINSAAKGAVQGAVKGVVSQAVDQIDLFNNGDGE